MVFWLKNRIVPHLWLTVHLMELRPHQSINHQDIFHICLLSLVFLQFAEVGNCDLDRCIPLHFQQVVVKFVGKEYHIRFVQFEGIVGVEAVRFVVEQVLVQHNQNHILRSIQYYFLYCMGNRPEFV